MDRTPPYVELHCHSAYSFLDGVSLPDELAWRACELGHAALALTDHNSVSGSMELAVIAKQYGLKTIHGAEIDLADRSEEHTSELQSQSNLVCRLLLEKKKNNNSQVTLSNLVNLCI